MQSKLLFVKIAPQELNTSFEATPQGRSHVSDQIHNSMNLAGKEAGMIKELLPVGKENAISSARLAEMAGCKSIRELQQVIAAEREAGAVILSSTKGGYFLPANAREIREFCATLASRGRNTFAALRSAKRALESYGTIEDRPDLQEKAHGIDIMAARDGKK